MFWDNVAWVYDIFVNVINRRTHQQLKQIIAELMERNDNVLECACGTGMLTEVMAQKCMHVTATDYAEKMLKRAEKNCAYVKRVYPQTVSREFRGLMHAELVLMYPKLFREEILRVWNQKRSQ